MVGQQTTTRCMADPQEHLKNSERTETKALTQSQWQQNHRLTVNKIISRDETFIL